MKLQSILKNKSITVKLTSLILMMVIFTIFGNLTASFLFDIDSSFGYKMIVLITSIFMFFIPGFIFFYLQDINIYNGLRLKLNFNRHQILLLISIMIFILPFIMYIAQINENFIMNLPESFSDLRSDLIEGKEKYYDSIEVFLGMNTFSDLLFNLLLLAIIPAIGEEIVYRGIFQEELSSIFSPHFAIIFTSFLFSVSHMEFFGFLPRFFLGLLLGYLFYYSGNLWMSILGHFLNNGFFVLSIYFAEIDRIGLISENPDIGLIHAFLSLGVVLMFLYLYIELRPLDNKKTE